MPLATRHRGEPHTELAPLTDFVVRRELDASLMASLQGRECGEIARRFAEGHRAYVATLNGERAAWGWVATRTAEIGELRTSVVLTDGERYLWNFVTLASHRGLGIYPRLLQRIVDIESLEAERFWIAYAPENHASGSGIRKAGFTALAELSFDRAGRPALHAMVPGGGVAAARVISLPESNERLAPCWRCVRAGRAGMTCAEGACRCDYQIPTSGCAAVSEQLLPPLERR